MAFYHNVVTDEFRAVDQLIIDNLKSEVGLVEDMGSYIVNAGGKRIRPVLVLLSALANGYSGGNKHLKIAAIIEFIHTATLLHDDVVDLSELRRGRQTANTIWGNAPSVLVGDFLYSRAFQMLVELADLRVMGVIADATNVISEGEVQQMTNAGNGELDEQTYLAVIYRKTAKLFEAAAACGAILTDGDSRAMADYGKHLGMAFQIADDVLDLQGDVDAMGKNIGDDLAEGKMTLPIIFARDHVSSDQSQLIRNAVESKAVDKLQQITEIVSASGGLAYSLDQARVHADLAKQALQAVPDNKYKQVLLKVADFAVTRSV
ncbi:MAG: polyprenyl synthetase family protein [Porticoccaceae bacterium]